MSIEAFPLQWPIGWKRTPAQLRREAKFGRASSRVAGYTPGRPLTMAEAVQRLLDEMERFAVRQDTLVISTNVKPTLAGLPRSGERKPEDPGAAIYWTDPFNGSPRVMAIDQYTRVEDNIAALAATVEAMRAIERHGGAVILERAFTGFTALPAPGQGAQRDWWEVLQVDRATVTREGCKAAYRRLASQFHPDKPGGSHEAMSELNAAQEKALQEVFR